MKLDAIVHFLDGFLNPKAYGQDTGLRISCAAEVRKVGAAVNLSFYAIEQAKHSGCDLLFTHHDAWDSTDADLVDRKHELLRRHNISLYVSHDPLDHHPEFGTSVVLAHSKLSRRLFLSQWGWRSRRAARQADAKRAVQADRCDAVHRA